MNDCTHHDTCKGPNIPRRYGTWRSELCITCGAWRTMTHGDNPQHISEWRTDSILDAAKRDEEL